MKINVDNKTHIDNYIQKHPDSKLGTLFPISLRGTKQTLEVYRLPINMLFYNIRNGRFAAEYKDLEKNEGGSLVPENKDDANKIKRLLLGLDPAETRRTRNDIKIRGQWNCGIITQDGYVIDGNRRMSIISALYDETGDTRWNFLDVARLNLSISPEDLWKLEAGIQLGMDEIVRYGPVNELLKIREGIEAGLSPKTIAGALYGYDEDTIQEKLKLLDLVERYLKFIGTPQKYLNVKNRVEHFINLQKIIAECAEMEYDADKIVNIRYAVFQLISEGVQHLELRKIRDMIKRNLDDAVKEIETAGSQLKPRIVKPSTPEEKIKGETHAIMDEFEEEEDEMSETYTCFTNAKDILDVSNNEGKEMLLLSRAEKNLRPLLDYPENTLPPEAISMIKKIAGHVEGLTKKFGI